MKKTKEQWDKLIMHDLMMHYNETEPINDSWRKKVKSTLESFMH